MANGLIELSDFADFAYKCRGYYNHDHGGWLS
ncbi:hypothetical protein JY490_11715 [Serratia marcescens]|nr:hypothetical protein [Serratia marcescens]MBN5276097.1 hypothetical protein [Serratia marcescens]MBN5306519.1 hypothetical protein [Serratia marcescens]MBN5364925.1 hypothetical protein [Serratia marcescens]MBN5420344.1 hypothetical protein [Serratia marcescens]